MAEVAVEVISDALNVRSVISVSGHEGMNQLSRWTVEVDCSEALDTEAVVGAPVTLVLTDRQSGTARNVGLLLTRALHDGTRQRQNLRVHHYSLELRPKEWLLTQRSGYEIHQGKSTPDLVKQVLLDAGTTAAQMGWRLSGSYGLRLHCVQYDETAWSFIERMLAEDGICYWFETSSDGPIIAFGDAPGSHDPIAGGSLSFHEGYGLAAADSIFELEIHHEVAPSAVHVRDYDVRKPDVPIEGKAGEGAFEHFEYPTCVMTADEAQARAQTRLEQLKRLSVYARGLSDSPRLQPGRTLMIEGSSDDELSDKWRVAELRHGMTAPAGAGETTPYRVEVLLVPATERTYRPALPRRKRVDGVESAITTGPAGEEIHVNDMGDLKIRFPWDRSGIFDDGSSAWMRCMQMNLGGAMLLPRVGWEVPVVYRDGNPDQALVLGRLYNAEGVVPYGLPGASATTALQSATSPGDGTTNEVRTADDAGSMEFFIHASRDQTVMVGGSATTDVGVDDVHDVTQSFQTAVTGSQTHDIGASQTINIGTDDSIVVGGGRTETVGALEHNKVTANRSLVVSGGYIEAIGALWALQCNQSNTDVKGMYTQTIAGAAAHAAGLGTSENVAGARAEAVGGARIITSAAGYGENAIGVKTITAGVHKITAGTHIATNAKAAGSLKVGGSAKFKASGPVVVKAPTITIDVSGSLKAGAFKMSGGAAKMTKGTSKLDGTIKRSGATKIK